MSHCPFVDLYNVIQRGAARIREPTSILLGILGHRPQILFFHSQFLQSTGDTQIDGELLYRLKGFVGGGTKA